MRFTLTYEGELRSNGGPRQKWDIRKYLHPQLQELWRITDALGIVQKGRRIPRSGYFLIERHHTEPEGPVAPSNDAIDLLEPITVGGRDFFPLVRDSLSLKCSLKIIF
jgi:hypothetical protein